MSTDADDLDKSFQIEQGVKGDRNQVIGQAIDSTIVNFAGEGQVIHLTIHDRVPENSAPPPISEVKPLTQQEYRQRQVLLNKVRDFWIKGVLEKSLHARALIELGLQERLDLVQRSFSGAAEFPETSGQALPDGTDATAIFDQMGAGRTLLILGEPGSGKTITLLKLAQDLVTQVQEGVSQPIPVVFNLSSWAKKQAIEKWLVQELLEKYQVSRALGKTWVEQESLILLLDGLDEVKAEDRIACVQALNQFMQTHGTTEITVCCRIKDYQPLAEQIRLRNAVYIQPLTAKQIDQYLEQAGEQLSTLKTLLHQDKELQALAASPLILSVMSLAYQDCRPEDITLGGTTADYRQRLLTTYVDRMFWRRGTTLQYPREQAQHWLIWLAQRMKNASQSVFLIERLQPRWLHTSSQKLLYSFANGLISGLFGGLIYGLTGRFLFGSTSSLIFGLAGGFTFGLVYGLSTWLDIESLGDIKTIETLKWSWKELKNSLYIGAIYGLIFGLICSLLIAQIKGIAYGLIFGFIYGLLGGFKGPEIQEKGYPNQGIIRSARNAITLGGISGLSCVLLSSVSLGWIYGLNYGLFYGLVGGLLGGGTACIRHFLLRTTLCLTGCSPWNVARFLDYAADRLFLQKVGGGYIFVHRMLLEHFAAMPLEQERR